MPNQTDPQRRPSRSFRTSTAAQRLLLPAVLLIAGAAACAPSSRIDVAHSGLTPAPTPQTYVLTQAAEPTPEDGKAAQAVERQLKALGWTAPAATPDWKVETAYVVRANSVGAVKPEGDDEAWLVQPERRRWWQRRSNIHALSVRLVQPATGEEFGRATAHLHLIGAMNDSLMDNLASAAVSRMVEDGGVPAS